ncbi:unnamed protein product [Meloidogyne enterolobii]|uniref:Uncharacterized protein n=1 Tax=Meloidogyne enterolobii TaxID=390850 RepID=A0ACB1AYA9_MELEN
MKKFKLLFKILILLKILIINSTQNINSNENEVLATILYGSDNITLNNTQKINKIQPWDGNKFFERKNNLGLLITLLAIVLGIGICSLCATCLVKHYITTNDIKNLKKKRVASVRYIHKQSITI